MAKRHSFPWIRVGKLAGGENGLQNAYGSRGCVHVRGIVEQLGQLSLVIPCLLPMGYIPSSRAAQLKPDYFEKLKAMKHVRYMGIFDIDANFKAVADGKLPLFKDEVPSDSSYGSADDVVRAFICRIRGMSLHQICAICPAFHDAHRAATTLVSLFERAGLSALYFFSGGKGFRVLVRDERLFFLVDWFGQYAESYVKYILPRFLRLQLAASTEELGMILDFVDSCVFDREKGVKPDHSRAHPTTNLFPKRICSIKDCITSESLDTELQSCIEDFWRWVVTIGSYARLQDLAYIQADLDIYKRKNKPRCIPHVQNEDIMTAALSRVDAAASASHAVMKGETIALLLAAHLPDALPPCIASSLQEDRTHFLYECFPGGSRETILAARVRGIMVGDRFPKLQKEIIGSILFPHLPAVRRHAVVLRRRPHDTDAIIYWWGIGLRGADEVRSCAEMLGGTHWMIQGRPACAIYGSQCWNSLLDEPEKEAAYIIAEEYDDQGILVCDNTAITRSVPLIVRATSLRPTSYSPHFEEAVIGCSNEPKLWNWKYGAPKLVQQSTQKRKNVPIQQSLPQKKPCSRHVDSIALKSIYHAISVPLCKSSLF